MLTGFKLHIITTSRSCISSSGTNSAKPLTTVLGSEKKATMVNFGGLMVRVLVSGSSGLSFNQEKGHCIVLLGKTLYFTLTVPLFTQVYKWVPANLLLVF